MGVRSNSRGGAVRRHRYKGALARPLRDGESAYKARIALLKDLGLDPASDDGWAAFEALAARHVPGMRKEGKKFPGRKRALEPDVEEHFLFYIEESKREAVGRGEAEPSIEALCEAASADPESPLYKTSPGTLRNIWSNRRERKRTDQRREHEDRVQRTAKLRTAYSPAFAKQAEKLTAELFPNQAPARNPRRL